MSESLQGAIHLRTMAARSNPFDDLDGDTATDLYGDDDDYDFFAIKPEALQKAAVSSQSSGGTPVSAAHPGQVPSHPGHGDGRESGVSEELGRHESGPAGGAEDLTRPVSSQG